MNQGSVTVGDNKIGGLFSPGTPVGGQLHELLGILDQQQFQISLLLFCAQVSERHSRQKTQLVYRIARSAKRLGGG